MAFYFKKVKKYIIMTERGEEEFKKNDVCRFCAKYSESDKVRNHGHLTAKYRGPAHSKSIIIVTQFKSNIIPFNVPSFSNYDCQMFFKKVFDKKND